MDPNNERRVFEMMVELLSTNENLAKTQYFLYVFLFIGPPPSLTVTD